MAHANWQCNHFEFSYYFSTQAGMRQRQPTLMLCVFCVYIYVMWVYIYTHSVYTCVCVTYAMYVSDIYLIYMCSMYEFDIYICDICTR